MGRQIRLATFRQIQQHPGPSTTKASEPGSGEPRQAAVQPATFTEGGGDTSTPGTSSVSVRTPESAPTQDRRWKSFYTGQMSQQRPLRRTRFSRVPGFRNPLPSASVIPPGRALAQPQVRQDTGAYIGCQLPTPELFTRGATKRIILRYPAHPFTGFAGAFRTVPVQDPPPA